jgi:hypothetical protein
MVSTPVTNATMALMSAITESETSDSSLSGSSTIAPIVTIVTTTSNKRPQRKYDPEIPLSKEETSAWRREQRRKRNRESAAACRKRQRDRIAELEGEVIDWKAKFDSVVGKLGEVEGHEGAMLHVMDIERKFPEKTCYTPDSSDTEDSMTVQLSSYERSYHMVTPTEARKFIPSLPTSSSLDLEFPVLQESSKIDSASFIKADSIKSRVEKGQHLSEMITRPAVSRLYLLRRKAEGIVFRMCTYAMKFLVC